MRLVRWILQGSKFPALSPLFDWRMILYMFHTQNNGLLTKVLPTRPRVSVVIPYENATMAGWRYAGVTLKE